MIESATLVETLKPDWLEQQMQWPTCRASNLQQNEYPIPCSFLDFAMMASREQYIATFELKPRFILPSSLPQIQRIATFLKAKDSGHSNVTSLLLRFQIEERC